MARTASGAAVVLTLMVDRQRLSSIAHPHHQIAAPIFGVNVNRLLRRTDRRPAARILDLGCGEATWAMQALAHYPKGLADGVYVSPYALERAAAAAAERGLNDRLTQSGLSLTLKTELSRKGPSSGRCCSWAIGLGHRKHTPGRIRVTCISISVSQSLQDAAGTTAPSSARPSAGIPA